MLFLSYAQEDSEIASRVAMWLDDHDVELFNWLAPEQRGRRFIEQIENAIIRADSFLALVSPSFIASPWCRRERHLAVQREMEIQAEDPDRIFINVLQVEQTPTTDTGFLAGYDWESAVTESDLEPALDRLVRRIRACERTNSRTLPAPPEPLSQADLPSPAEPRRTESEVPLRFRNRSDELDKVIRGLTTSGDSHFWLITAPPQLGKSWLLREICRSLEQQGWDLSLVDLRKNGEMRTDAAALLARLFGITPEIAVGPEPQLRIAQLICQRRRPYLCLLDSAELLDEPTATTLRSQLIEIYNLVRGVNIDGVRLGVVISSRTEGRWRGVKKPRMQALPLSEFDSNVVYEALSDLAQDIGSKLSATEIKEVADLVYDLTEGLPALLTRCMQWILRERWMLLRRLATSESFKELASPYIEDGLLSYDSLFPGLREASDELPEDDDARNKAAVLHKAYQALSLYRLFTQSHLRFHLESDPDFQAVLDANNWSVTDLWDSISGAALLSRPLDEPWQAMPTATRRLLYRHFLENGSIPADAQQTALGFMREWSEQQLGKEQTIGLVECVWHQAMALRSSDPAELERRLIASADTLSCELRPSAAYTVKELRRYAVMRIEADAELEKTISHVDGLWARLIEVVRNPPSQSETPSE